jgi:ubiquinone biosynthesis protein COQ4
MNILIYLQQRWQTLVTGYRFIQLVQSPYGDFSAIRKLSNVIDTPEKLKQTIKFLSSHEQGARALKEHPRLGDINLQSLYQLPSNTLGHLYADHLIKNALTSPLTPNTVDNYSFPGVHILETHDIWHVVTGCDTTKAGEIELEAFYTAQIYPSPTFLALLAKNLMKTAIEDIELCSEHMNAFARGWMRGKEAKPLFGIQWNTKWEIPLQQLRTELNLNLPLNETLLSGNHLEGIALEDTYGVINR